MGAWGAYRLFSAEQPKSDWIVELFSIVGERPSYAAIAPDGYSPEQERKAGRERAEQIQESVD